MEYLVATTTADFLEKLPPFEALWMKLDERLVWGWHVMD
jgi:hypothetical protein